MLKLALRNVFRHRLRTAMTLAAIVFGVTGLILSGGFVHDIYHQLGESFRNLKGHRAAVLSGNEDFESAFGIRPRGPRRTLWNGPLRCTLYRYEL